MTAQVPEILLLDGEKHGMCTEPLARYLRSIGTKANFRAPNTSCWRGYIGTWGVIDGRLCLTAIEGNLKSGEIANLETIFPNATGPVFAHWFSGVLRIPQGEVLEYVHGA
ncbi:MAG: hypothetical protein CFE32_13595 [Alphaproteobacteria bacterium PA3]|nr:MAG: hypothetical protein CFE32_13595 [Alphaproteobacteria bacterium PA3]